jgi:hypothetical protein
MREAAGYIYVCICCHLHPITRRSIFINAATNSCVVWVGGSGKGAEGWLVFCSMLRLHDWRVLCCVHSFYFIFGFFDFKKIYITNKHTVMSQFAVSSCARVSTKCTGFKRALYSARNSTDVHMQRGKIKTKSKCLRFLLNYVSSSSIPSVLKRSVTQAIERGTYG